MIAGGLQELALDVGWTLVHFIWQGAIVAALYALLMALLRNSSAGIRYAVSVVTFFILSIIPFLTLAYLRAEHSGAAMADAEFAGFAELGAFTAASSTMSWYEQMLALIESVLPFAVIAWIAGVFVLSVRFASSLRDVQRLQNSANEAVPGEWVAVLQKLISDLGMQPRIRIAISDLVQSPLVVGWIKPMILFPTSALSGLSVQQLEMILAHELAHIQRNDYLINLYQVLIETLLFYHPAVKWISTRIRIERERCCDDLAVDVCGDALAYARALTRLEDMRVHMNEPQLQLGIADHELLDRIQRLVARSPRNQNGSIWVLGAFMLGMIFISVSAIQVTLQDFESSTDDLDALSMNVASYAAPDTAIENEIAETVAEKTAVVDSTPMTTEPVKTTLDAPRPEATTEASRHENALAVVGQEQEALTETPAKQVDAVDLASAPKTIKPAAAPETRLAVASPAIQTPQINADTTENIATTTPEPAAQKRVVKVESSLKPASGRGATDIGANVAETKEKSEISGGKVIHAVTPEYPYRAQRDGISGQIKLAFTVDKKGRVRNVEVIKAVPAKTFNRVAMDAVKQWRFTPFTVEGKAIDRRVTQVIDFNPEKTYVSENDRNCYRMTGSRICRKADKNDPQRPQNLAIIKLRHGS
ncbi:MAG: M56 family metallopeptidase [Gammaproteobacteria bacterium]|nr:M56 family metallopeptidase [Gammaproteobacteria bacterium]